VVHLVEALLERGQQLRRGGDEAGVGVVDANTAGDLAALIQLRRSLPARRGRRR
jgi:hypothetical protein